jgi:hypothetical protein
MIGLAAALGACLLSAVAGAQDTPPEGAVWTLRTAGDAAETVEGAEAAPAPVPGGEMPGDDVAGEAASPPAGEADTRFDVFE